MSELVLFYSYSGHTKKTAQKFAADNNCDICEIADEKRPNKLYAYSVGCFKALKGSALKIQPLTVNGNAVKFEDYGVVNIFAPIWAGHPAPSMNAALKLIPTGIKIKLFMISGGGESNKPQITKRIEALGFEIAGYEDIKN